MRKLWNMQADAFITIEYTLLLPVLLLLYTFLIYIGIYQYDQCILQTNMYLLGSKGAALYIETPEEKLQCLQEIEQHLYYDKYLLAEQLQTAYSVKGNRIQLNGSGKVFHPLSVFGLGGTYWELHAKSEATAASGANILRLCKQAKNLIKDIKSQ